MTTTLVAWPTKPQGRRRLSTAQAEHLRGIVRWLTEPVPGTAARALRTDRNGLPLFVCGRPLPIARRRVDHHDPELAASSVPDYVRAQPFGSPGKLAHLADKGYLVHVADVIGPSLATHPIYRLPELPARPEGTPQ